MTPRFSSLIKLGLIALSTVLTCFFVAAASLLDRHGKLAYRLSTIWFESVLMISRVGVKVRGLEHLDCGQSYIFVANHRSYYDVPALGIALKPFQLRWAAKKELLKIPFFGWGLRASRHVIVDRNKPRRAVRSLVEARERLRVGISMVFFPEGTRSRNGGMLRFKKGSFLLAVETGTPVVPVAINGSGRVLGENPWHIRGGEIEVVVGPPILVKGYTMGEVDLLGRRAREFMERHYRG
jgi:1-acyl-sn-glycerol-3-phosphate acyltransferase